VKGRLRSGAKEIGSVWFARPPLTAITLEEDDLAALGSKISGSMNVGETLKSPNVLKGKGGTSQGPGGPSKKKLRKKVRGCRSHRKGVRTGRLSAGITTLHAKTLEKQPRPSIPDRKGVSRKERRLGRLIGSIRRALICHAMSATVKGESERRDMQAAANAVRRLRAATGRYQRRHPGSRAKERPVKPLDKIGIKLARNLQSRCLAAGLEFGTKVLKEWRRCTVVKERQGYYGTDQVIFHPRLVLFDRRLGVKKHPDA